MTASKQAEQPTDEIIEALRSNSAIASIAKYTAIPIERVVVLVKEANNFTELTYAVELENHEEVGHGKGTTLFYTPDHSEQFKVELNAARQLLGCKPYSWPNK